MTTLSPQELTNLRTLDHSTDLHVSVWQPEILLSAQITGSPSRGDTVLLFSTLLGNWADVRPWQLVHFGTLPGRRDVFYGRVKDIINGQITVDDNGVPWQVGHYITVYRYYPPITTPARQVEVQLGGQSDVIQFKFSSLSYQDANQPYQQPPPVCIAGPPKVGRLDAGAITFDVDLTDSYPIAPGASISSYGLTIEPDDANSTVNFNTSTGIGTVDITAPGEYYLHASCTDSNGKSETRFVPVKVHDDQAVPYFSAEIRSIRNTYGQGLAFQVEAFGQDVTLQAFIENALVILWDENPRPADILGVGNIYAVGYLQKDVSTDQISTDGSHNVVLHFVSIEKLNLPLHDFEQIYEPNPFRWNHLPPWGYMGFCVHALFKWHSSILQVVDVYGLDQNPIPNFDFQFTAGRIFDNINQTAKTRSFSILTADEAGRLHFDYDINMLNTTGRDAQDTVFTIQEQDLSGAVTINYSPQSEILRLLFGGAIGHEDSAQNQLHSVIPAWRPSNYTFYAQQPTGARPRLVESHVISTQQDCNEKCGRLFAYENRDIKNMRFSLRGNYHGAFSTVRKYGWYQWGIANSVLKRGLDISNTRWVCQAINLEPTTEGDLVTTVVLEPEVFGPNGVQGNYPNTMPQPVTTPDWTSPDATPAVITFSSMHYRDSDDPLWDEITTRDYNHGTLDVWWKLQARTSNPTSINWWGCGQGFIEFHNSLNSDAISRTPTNFLNEWGDGISAFDTDFKQVVTDEWDESRVYTINTFFAPSTDYHSWLLFSNTNGQSWTTVNLYDAVQPTSIFPLWISVGRLAIWVTVWADGQLILLKYAKSSMIYNTEYALGPAAFADLANRTFYAYPVRVKDADSSDEPVYVAGRMQDPVGLTGVHHIIKRESGVWSNVENTWDTDHCASLLVFPVDNGDRQMFAYRQGL